MLFSAAVVLSTTLILSPWASGVDMPLAGGEPSPPVTTDLLHVIDYTHEDHDSGRPDAHIEIRLLRGTQPGTASLVLGVSAVDPRIAAPPGYDSLSGTNRITAEELRMLVHHQRSLSGTNRDVATGRQTAGEFTVARVGTLPMRRLSSGSVDYLAQTSTRYPLSIELSTKLSGNGRHVTTWSVDTEARLKITVELDYHAERPIEGRIVEVVRHDPSPHAILPAGLFAFNTLDGSVANLTAQPPWFDPAEWEPRDIEGRWVLLNEHLQVATEIEGSQWVRFFAQRGEFELLEWLAVYKPRQYYVWKIGPTLRAFGSTRALRLALWCARATDGHTMTAANLEFSEGDPRAALAWFNKYPEAQKQAPNMYKQLLAQKIDPSESRSLPPLTEADVFSHLGRTGAIEDFLDRRQADPGKTYLHQVTREIDGFVRRYDHASPYAKVLADLTHHSRPDLQQHALLGYTFIPPEHIPRETLSAIWHDSKRWREVREAAFLAYTYAKHPEVNLEVHRIALDPLHPAWSAAVSRLGDFGDGFTIKLLESNLPNDMSLLPLLDPALQAIRKRLTAAGKDPMSLAQRHLERAAYAREHQHVLADRVYAWTVAWLLTQEPVHVEKKMRTIIDSLGPSQTMRDMAAGILMLVARK